MKSTRPPVTAFYIARDASLKYPVRISFSEIARPAGPANTQFTRIGIPYIHAAVIRTSKFETIRVLAWENPHKSGEYLTGFLHESWPPGQYMTGWPAIRLRSLQAFDNRIDAINARDKLATGKTFSQITALYPQCTLISQNPRDLPFIQPSYWKDKTARSLRPVAN